MSSSTSLTTSFDDYCKKSWPYCPLKDLYETHLEMNFVDHRKSKLDQTMPSGEELRRQWWTNRFKELIHTELTSRKLYVPVYVPNETLFFKRYPDLRSKWDLIKTNILLKELSLDNSCSERIIFNDQLKQQWISKIKNQFMMNSLGLTTDCSKKREFRKKCFAKYSKCLLWCRHPKCWKIRIKYLPALPFIWLSFQLYGTSNQHIYDIEVTEKL